MMSDDGKRVTRACFISGRPLFYFFAAHLALHVGNLPSAANDSSNYSLETHTQLGHLNKQKTKLGSCPLIHVHCRLLF